MGSVKIACIAGLLAGAFAFAEPGRAQNGSHFCLTDERSSAPFTFDSDARALSGIIGIRECWPANVADDDHLYLNDLYTRWVVEEIGSNAPSPLIRDYRSERHSPIERFFVGRTRGTTISVKIRMRDPDVDFTIPLMSVDYDGRRGQGQSFTTLLSRSDMSLPDFRISPTSTASIEANARTSNELDIQATGIVLGALRDTLAIVSPGSSLLTSVNREQVQRTASAYDTALSKLLSSSVAETTTTSRLLSEWQQNSSILVGVDVPAKIRTRGSAPGMERRIWFRIKMACPRLSIFDTMNVCELVDDDRKPVLISSPHGPGSASGSAGGRPGAGSIQFYRAVAMLHDRISPHQVLSFRLGQGKSLRQFLTEQEWFISLSKKMVTASAEQNFNAANSAPATADKATTTEAGATVIAQITAPVAGNRTGAAPRAPKSKELSDNIVAANELCEAITEKLYAAGLSRLDANIGLWGAVTGMPDFANSRGIFQAAPACREHLPLDPEYSQWRFEERPREESAAAAKPKRGAR